MAEIVPNKKWIVPPTKVLAAITAPAKNGISPYLLFNGFERLSPYIVSTRFGFAFLLKNFETDENANKAGVKANKTTEISDAPNIAKGPKAAVKLNKLTV